MRWFSKVRSSGIGGKILLLAMLGGLGMVGIAGMNRLLAQRVELERSVGQHADRVTRCLLSMMLLEQEFINTSEKRVLGGYQELVQSVKTACQSIREKSHDSRIQAQMVEIDTLLKEHDQLFNEMSVNLEKTNIAKKEINEGIQNLQAAMEGIVKDIDQRENQLVMVGDDLPANVSNTRREIKSYLSLWYVKELNIQDLLLFGRLDELKSKESELAAKIKLNGSNIDTLLVASNDAKLTERWQKAMKSVPSIEQLGIELVQHWQANRDLMLKLKGNARSVQDAAQHITEMTNEQIGRSYAMAETFGIGAVLVGLASLGILCFCIHRSVTKSLKGTIEALTCSSDQAKRASAQIALASQSLAEGASEQAASLEETSASLEEIASMTRQNANNADHADSLMKETNRVVATAASSMIDLTHSMREISQASEETSKIIKTIDAIAFQTNLLALNAAVEAARAGEAGAGFAVVADEVRNLAMRAANAAKDTSGLIESTVKRIQDGSELVSRTNAAFSEVAKSVAKAGDLVGEISAASSEQAQGIGELNKAMAEMDKVVQQNTANAEESASASAEMSTQAEQMREFVGSLVMLVGGDGNWNRDSQSVPAGKAPIQIAAPISPSKRMLPSLGKSSGKGNRSEGNVLKKGTMEVKPEQVIPLDDEDFREF